MNKTLKKIAAVLWFALSAFLIYFSIVLIHESQLRAYYHKEVKQIPLEADFMAKRGGNSDDIASYTVDARNELKAKVRDMGNPLMKKMAEERNKRKYGNELGPNYRELQKSLRKKGIKEEKLCTKIIESAGSANRGTNRKMKRAGYMGIGILLCCLGISIQQIYSHKSDRTYMVLYETTKYLGALIGGSIGVYTWALSSLVLPIVFGFLAAIMGSIIGAFFSCFLLEKWREKLLEKVLDNAS